MKYKNSMRIKHSYLRVDYLGVGELVYLGLVINSNVSSW